MKIKKGWKLLKQGKLFFDSRNVKKEEMQDLIAGGYFK